MAHKRKEDRQAYARRHYEGDRERYTSRAIVHKAAMAVIAQTAVLRHLEQHPCVDCGEADPLVLEFDHREPADKHFSIGDAARGDVGLERLVQEMAKCDVRCANCHRRKTARERGYMRAMLMDGSERAEDGAPLQTVVSLFGEQRAVAASNSSGLVPGAFSSVPGYGFHA